MCPEYLMCRYTNTLNQTDFSSSSFKDLLNPKEQFDKFWQKLVK